ncbi:hypothetical protein [Leptolyngbya sp. FACHB-261]|uniref:hypothetical protein n=1 Tax=Leptolyngbya sp. FACHB-261 TaxID=2692806 RepID=UPI0018F00126|nr:hypothetical protein [Leptolyngbya sp. FACHB-261]
MKLHYIKEPSLEFGRGSHVCPRAGITEYDVYDTRLKIRRERVLIGAVGTSDMLSKLHAWLDKCSQLIPPQANSRQPNLRVAFCGFRTDLGFRSELVIDEEITRTLSHSDINEIIKIKSWNERVDATVELYYRQAKFLAQNRVVDVIACVLPAKLYDCISKSDVSLVEESLEDKDEQDNDDLEVNFRRALKARAMHLGKPLQIIRETSLEPNSRGQQDDATKAWNLCTALYYKTNQTVPWKLSTNINRPSVCFVGISFYRSRDRRILNTSLAQIFDELGNNVILRGNPVDLGKKDRRPHLSAEQAFELLKRALIEYEIALDTSPARLVLHKSSKYSDEELDGFEAATREMRVRKIDFVTILDSDFLLLRGNDYPAYRGMHVEFDDNNHLLYTRG